MGRATHEAVYEARHALDLVADDPVDGGPDVPPGVVRGAAPRAAVAVPRVAAHRGQARGQDSRDQSGCRLASSHVGALGSASLASI